MHFIKKKIVDVQYKGGSVPVAHLLFIVFGSPQQMAHSKVYQAIKAISQKQSG